MSEQRCPDDGACHHNCKEGECFRVHHCCPLSSYGEDWKPEDYEDRAKPEPSIDSVIAEAG